MAVFRDKQIHPKDRRPTDEPPASRPIVDTVHPQTQTPARRPVNSKVVNGVIQIPG